VRISSEFLPLAQCSATERCIGRFKYLAVLNTWLIEQLKKINLPTFILTNNSERMVIDELKENKVEGYFAGVFGNSLYKKTKQRILRACI
jgi:hypothetical protein